MAKSLFQKNNTEGSAPTPRELIESEIVHLKKGSSVRYGNKSKPTTSHWLLILGICGLAWFYLMDPILHAWYKGEAIRALRIARRSGRAEALGDLPGGR